MAISSAEFKAKIESIVNHGGGMQILITQVDPDALASAFGLQYILKEICPSMETSILYCGSISHPQNRAIANYFNLLNQMHEFNTANSASTFALVDSHDVVDSRLRGKLDAANLCLVIDHHRADVTDLQHASPQALIWIEEVGSASTLVVELLQELGISYEDDAKFVYNLLALGIYTDTKSLVSATSRDLAAFAAMQTQLDPLDIARFISYPLPSSYFKNFAQALGSFQHQDSKGVANLGFLSKTDRDDISSLADLLLRKEGISMVAVWAIIEDSVAISFRSLNMSIPLESFIKERFNGMGGAKLSADGRAEGGALVPLNMSFWITAENRASLLDLVQHRMCSLIFN